MNAAVPALPTQEAGIAGQARLERGFRLARATLAIALLLVQGGLWLLDDTRDNGAQALLTLAYAASALLGGRAWPQAWWVDSGVDLLVFTLMLALGGSLAPPVTALMVLPVLVSAVLGSRRTGLMAAALATLGLLGASVWASLVVDSWTPSVTQAGLSGIGYFALALLSSELATRLVREEQAALGSMAMARQQQALSQLVIDEMQEGLLVLDRSLQVRAANPAARALLGELEPVADTPFSLRAERAWMPLAQAVEEAWAAAPAETRREVTLGFARAPARALRLRPRWMGEAAEPLLVLLLEDRAKLQARSRQEKLAAMGRMSAGIAHEIRNPLSAISQANALLAEDLQGDAGGERLTALVESNVKRLQRIVDEVMLLAAPPDAAPPPMDATAGLRETLLDWQRTQPGAHLQAELPAAALAVLFEPEHLRRVLINLLDNGWRHAQSQARPWLRVELQTLDAERALLRVLNPSPPLPAHIERHLFEPFHSTRSRSSGLGLYICRELCERYGARIEYQALQRGGEPAVCFSITLRRPAGSE